MMYVLDTCVLFPTVVRNILLKLALSGEFKPVCQKTLWKNGCGPVRKMD